MSGTLSISGIVPTGVAGEKHYITVEDRELAVLAKDAAVEARTGAEAAQGVVVAAEIVILAARAEAVTAADNAAVDATAAVQQAGSQYVAAAGDSALAAANWANQAQASANTLVLPTTELVTEILATMPPSEGIVDDSNFLKLPDTWLASTLYTVGSFFIQGSVIFYVLTEFTSGTTAPIPGDAAPLKSDSTFAVWASPANIGSSLVRRSAEGEVWVTAAYATQVPVEDTELTNKLYVDTAVAKGSPAARPCMTIPIIWNGVAWTHGREAIATRPEGMIPGDILEFSGGAASNRPSFAAEDDARIGITGA